MYGESGVLKLTCLITGKADGRAEYLDARVWLRHWTATRIDGTFSWKGGSAKQTLRMRFPARVFLYIFYFGEGSNIQTELKRLN